MKKSTILLAAGLMIAGAANAQVRWNPENSWATDNGKTILPVGEDGKSAVNKLVKQDNGNWRADIRYAATANLIEDEPYMVFQITTEGCVWNLNDFKFEFMLQRKLSEGLDDNGNVKWGGNTESTDANYPSFNGDKYKVVDQYEADLYQLLGSKVGTADETSYTEDVIVIDLNKVKATDADKTPGLLFSAGDVHFPNINGFETIVEPDENGEGGVQQRSWMGFVCIAPGASVTVDQPTFTVHYTGSVEDSSDALMVCEDYANGDGGQEVRDGEEESAVEAVAVENVNIYLKNGKVAVAPGAEAMEAYSIDGKKVANGVDSIELPAGIYVVKAVKNGVATTVKAIVR
ncbi:MAG: T9SS type A sorting domain-containing protein [Muribaculaceae bacterium]|nr:T9SS type A sorting domain-containing protein [Muribaculaceae bacterium]